MGEDTIGKWHFYLLFEEDFAEEGRGKLCPMHCTL